MRMATCFPSGIRQLDRITALVEDETSDVPAQIAEKAARITERTTKLKTLAVRSDRARRLQTVPGIGAGCRAADGPRDGRVRA